MTPLISVFLTAASDPSPLPDFSQLGVFSIVCVILSTGIFFVWRTWRSDLKDHADSMDSTIKKYEEALTVERGRTEALRLENVALQQQALVRERELVNGLGPLLADSLKVMAATPGLIDRATDRWERAVERLERLGREA